MRFSSKNRILLRSKYFSFQGHKHNRKTLENQQKALIEIHLLSMNMFVNKQTHM